MEKQISIYKDFNEYDLQKKSIVEKIANKISIEENREIILDLTYCLIDYHSTYMLIDKLLFDLSKLKGEKKIRIETALNLGLKTFYMYFFHNSKFFGLTNQTELSFNDAMKEITKKLRGENLSFIISISEPSGKKIKELDLWKIV